MAGGFNIGDTVQIGVRITPLLNQVAEYYNSFASKEDLELAATWELSGKSP